jgi:hypothetical protein
MVSRWAYEALTVNQFLNNHFQREYVDLERLESNVTYDMQFLAPALIQEIRDAEDLFLEDPGSGNLKAALFTIRNAFSSISLTSPFDKIGHFREESFSPALADEAVEWLENYRRALQKHRDRLTLEKDARIDSLAQAAGGKQAYLLFRREYQNESISNLVLNRNALHKIVKREGKLVRKYEPVYMPPLKRNGRAHFYASVKQIGNIQINTVVFNILVIWFHTLVFYLLLRFSILRRILDFFAYRGKLK